MVVVVSLPVVPIASKESESLIPFSKPLRVFSLDLSSLSVMSFKFKSK